MLKNITVQWHTNNLKEIAQLHNESQIYAYSLVYPPHVVNWTPSKQAYFSYLILIRYFSTDSRRNIYKYAFVVVYIARCFLEAVVTES